MYCAERPINWWQYKATFLQGFLQKEKRKGTKAVFPFCGNMNLYRGYNSPQELNVFQQEIEIRICKKTQFFSIAYYFISNWIAFIMLGGNLLCALIIVHICCNWRDNGCKILQWSWHDFMRIQFKKVFCWQSRTSEERMLKEFFFSSHFHPLKIPKKMWIFEIFAI